MGQAEQQKLIRKLMLHTLNKALRKRLIVFKVRQKGITEAGCAEITVGSKPTIINWRDTGHNELRVSVWWDFRPDQLPLQMKNKLHDLTLLLPDVNRDRFRFVVGACASCYFDYQQRGILSDKGKEFFALYVRESTASDIDELEEVKPFGYTISELSRPLQRILPAGGKRGRF